MTKQHSDRSTSRDDADARGEHQYPEDPTRPKRQVAKPFERDPDHYAAGANGTQQVTAASSSGKSLSTAAKPGSLPGDVEKDIGNGGDEKQQKSWGMP